MIIFLAQFHRLLHREIYVIASACLERLFTDSWRWQLHDFKPRIEMFLKLSKMNDIVIYIQKIEFKMGGHCRNFNTMTLSIK